MERSPAVFFDAARRSGMAAECNPQGRPPCMPLGLGRKFEAERGGGGLTPGYGGLHGRRGRVCACRAIGFCISAMVQEWQPAHELRIGGCSPGAPRFLCRRASKSGCGVHGSVRVVSTRLAVRRDQEPSCFCHSPSPTTPSFAALRPAMNPHNTFYPILDARAHGHSAGRRGGLAPLRMCTRHVEGDCGIENPPATPFSNGGLPRGEDRFEDRALPAVQPIEERHGPSRTVTI